MPSQSSSKKGPLSEDECASLRAKLKAQGLDFVREVTGLDATTILRAASGLSVHNSTALLLRLTVKDQNGQ